jgi:hypothetical protein
MTTPLLTLRARLRPVFCTGLTWATLLAGAAGVLAPAALMGSAWPPLHARCVGITALSLAVEMARARRALDPAALRMPLLALACWCLSTVALAWSGGNASSFWPCALVIVGVAALAFAQIEGDTHAPAQHADRVWRSFAGLAMLVAMSLLIAPRGMLPYWPWRLSAILVAQYAPMFLVWGAAAWLMSRERRRYVRMPMLWGLLVWAAGVLLARRCGTWRLSGWNARRSGFGSPHSLQRPSWRRTKSGPPAGGACARLWGRSPMTPGHSVGHTEPYSLTRSEP